MDPGAKAFLLFAAGASLVAVFWLLYRKFIGVAPKDPTQGTSSPVALVEPRDTHYPGDSHGHN